MDLIYLFLILLGMNITLRIIHINIPQIMPDKIREVIDNIYED